MVIATTDMIDLKLQDTIISLSEHIPIDDATKLANDTKEIRERFKVICAEEGISKESKGKLRDICMEMFALGQWASSKIREKHV